MANIKNDNKKKLLKKHNIFTGKSKNYPSGVAPGKEVKSDKGEPPKMGALNLPNDLKKVWDFFEKDFRVSNQDNTPEQRQKRDEELYFMIHNEGLMYSATQVYTNETTQADSQDRIIGIKGSKGKTETYFYKWLQDIGLTNNVMNALSWDLTAFGNGFYIKSVDLEGAGITSIAPIDQSECKDVIEFQGVRVKKAMEANQSFTGIVNRFDSLKKLSSLFSKEIMTTDYSLWYKPYIFGYTVGDNVLPPWAVSHFRRYTTSSEFYPYGRPMFIGSLARYKSYKTTEMLVDMARPASFPTKVMEIEGHEDMTETELYQKINQVREMYKNITAESKNKDELSVGEMIFTVKGLTTFNQFETRLDLNQLGDLDAKRSDLILSTGIPEGYLDSSKSNWGASGQALLQQSKIVARNIYPSQTSFLEVLTDDFKTHLMLTNDLEGENTEFELYMNYPVIEESSDRMRLKSDSIRLANDILANLGTSLGLDRGEALPSEVVASVFGKYSFLDMEEIADWVASYEKEKTVQESFTKVLETIEDKKEKEVFLKEAKKFETTKNNFLRNLNFETPFNIKEKIEERLSEEIVREVYFKTKREINLIEGVSLNGKHFLLKNAKESLGSSFDLLKKEKSLRTMKIQEEEAKKSKKRLRK